MDTIITRAMKTSLLLSVLVSSMTYSAIYEVLPNENKTTYKRDENGKFSVVGANESHPFIIRKALLAFGVGMGIGAGLESTQFIFGKNGGVITFVENKVGKSGLIGTVALTQGVNLLVDKAREKRQQIEGDATPLNTSDQIKVTSAGFCGVWVGKFLMNSLFTTYVGGKKAQGNGANLQGNASNQTPENTSTPTN